MKEYGAKKFSRNRLKTSQIGKRHKVVGSKVKQIPSRINSKKSMLRLILTKFISYYKDKNLESSKKKNNVLPIVVKLFKWQYSSHQKS